jgi:hypothetical protein
VTWADACSHGARRCGFGLKLRCDDVAPLGVAGNLIYLDSTWFPVQLDAYFPLAVTTLDATTGTALHEYGYKSEAHRGGTEAFGMEMEIP